MAVDDYKAVAKEAVLDEETFLKATFSGPRSEGEARWVRIVVRPVSVKGVRKFQFSYFDGKKDIAKNFSGAQAERRLDEALAMPFGQILVQSASADVQLRISKKGAVSIMRRRPSRREEAPDLSHDRAKRHLLPADASDPLLEALRIVDRNGKVRSAMRGKFSQINEFLRVIDQVLPGKRGEEPVGVIDCGCGSAYLTFAAYHYLNHVRGVPARVAGMDANKDLIRKCTGLRDSLGWDGLEFHVSSIADFEPAARPAIVLSLHACDTATDEAIAQGIKWKSRVILAAPCCQHELHQQLKADALRAVLRQGILRERLADIVTDAFRALALRIMGYRTSVAEFVSPESTSKNLMIRAEWGVRPGQAGAVAEYADLKEFWRVTPAIERMLGEDFRRLVAASG